MKTIAILLILTACNGSPPLPALFKRCRSVPDWTECKYVGRNSDVEGGPWDMYACPTEAHYVECTQ